MNHTSIWIPTSLPMGGVTHGWVCFTWVPELPAWDVLWLRTAMACLMTPPFRLFPFLSYGPTPLLVARHFPNKPSLRDFLFQGLLLGKPKLRYLITQSLWNEFPSVLKAPNHSKTNSLISSNTIRQKQNKPQSSGSKIRPFGASLHVQFCW